MGVSSVVVLEQQLMEAGNKLLNIPSSVDELLNLLDRIELLLASVEQQPSDSMKVAVLPSMKALSTPELLRHSNMDVRITVASCMSEITRITAPDAPYNDDLMKEIFQLTVAAFEKLSNVSTRCYAKAVSMLDTTAKVRSGLLMLDLQCDALIIKMFQHFLKTIRSNHPHAVFLAMETVMSLIIEESEEISMDLLIPLLTSIRKENQNTSPISWKLGKKVVTNCAAKLEPHLLEAVRSKGISLDDYAEIVTSICQKGFDTDGAGLTSDTVQHDHVSGSAKNMVTTAENATTAKDDLIVVANSSKPLEACLLTKHAKCSGGSAKHDDLASSKNAKSEVSLKAVPKKRGRRPNCLMNPDEGYEYWTQRERKSRKPRQKNISHSPANPIHEKGSMLNQDPDLNFLSAAKVNIHVKEEPVTNTDPQEEQQRMSVVEERGRNFNGDWSSVQTDNKKRRRRAKGTSDKDITEASGVKARMSESETKHKRKWVAVKEESSEMPDLDGRLVGHRIKVWWPLDKTFYEGVVDSFERRTSRHKVVYDDGEVENLNLRYQLWELIKDLPDTEQDTDLPKPHASSDVPQKEEDVKPESGKHVNTGSSSKRKQTSSRKQRGRTLN